MLPEKMSFNPESSKEIFKIPEKKKEVFPALPDDHWFKIAERLHKESGEVPDPLQIRAAAIVEALGIPSSQYSALELEKDKEGKVKTVKEIVNGKEIEKRTKKEKDKIIAEFLTNKAGVEIDKKTGIVSHDFRDIYPEGLPDELKKILDPDTLAIMETEYKHSKYVREKFGNTKAYLEADCPVNYSRLPGGIDLFLRGYVHNKEWQKNHGKFLKEINKQAKVICVEGFKDKPLGKSLDLRWNEPESQRGHYDALMHEAVDNGFKGLFTEIDARDMSKIKTDVHDGGLLSFLFPGLSSVFYKKYFEFFQKEHPTLAKIISSPEDLKQALIAQSTTDKGLYARDERIYRQGRYYHSHPYFSKEGKVSFEPTFLELGQRLFSDALSAIKLHLIAKLMIDGHIEKGSIVDHEGADHLSSKSFFLRELQYAMEVVLRNPNELMAGRVKEKSWRHRLLGKSNIPEIYKVFENPNWQDIVEEIAKLAFKEVENDPSKSTNIGPNQRKLIDKPIDFLETYGINPEKVMPTAQKIKEIRERFQ